MNIIISHPTGNANVKAAVEGIATNKALAAFYTSIAVFPGTALYFLSEFGPLAEIRKRNFSPVLQPYTKTKPVIELCRLLALKAGFKGLVNHERGVFSIDAVSRGLDQRVAGQVHKWHKNQITAAYAYEDAARYTFNEAKKNGILCLYDLPIGYWRASREIMEAERQRWPDWSSTLLGLKDSAEKLAKKDDELKLADHIFVASRFTAKTLEKYPGQLGPVHIIPYGYPAVGANRGYTSQPPAKLKLLFVGGLSQRKGIADMFKVADKLKQYVSLTVVGRKAAEGCDALNKALAAHTWIPALPHNEILKLMRGHDVLLFPSLFEGFGLVITEAMSQGTPVITTERTAGPDLIEHGRNGWITKAGNTDSLQAIIEELLAKPYLVSQNGREAMESARSRPWAVYGTELVNKISQLV